MLTNQISEAVAIIQHGGVIAYSTDTILGLGCDPNNRSAIKRVLWLKQRSIEKGLILLVENLEALQQFSQPLTATQCADIVSTASATTWLLPAHDSIPKWITGKHDRVAIRITQHPIANQICKAAGAIVSTSANFSNDKQLDKHCDLRSWFGPYLDYVIIGAPGSGFPSEVRDLVSGEILRQGG